MVAGATQPTGGATFGGLLRRHRVAAALSQEALAARAGLSTRAVSDLERGVKTRPHLDTVRRLTEALALPLADRSALAAAARPERPDVGPSPTVGTGAAAPITHLPVPAAPLVGREREVAAVPALLRAGEARLVTLTGPGGVGKTRLALATASRAAAAYPDGVVWVEFASLADPAHVPGAVARALGVREAAGRAPAETLRDALRARRMLLVLDNCEHLRWAVGELAAELLGACPGLALLATSRAPLRLAAERLFIVGPLALPEGDTAEFEAVVGTAAVRLFAQRARAVRPEFDLTEANVADVAEVCRRLDGLPLAIELAAARIRVLSPAALRALLEERLRVLGEGPADAPARHRTLRNAIAWSHDLLDEDQQALFRRLAVFAGGCGLEAVAAVCANGDPFAALAGLEALVDEGLLRRIDGPGDEPRFGMLETVGAFAVERLAASGEAEVTRRQHAAWHLAFVDRAAGNLEGSAGAERLSRLETDYTNLRAALAWAEERGEAETALRLVDGLWRFWDARGHLAEGLASAERALGLGGDVAPELRAAVLFGVAYLARSLGDYDRARVACEESLALCRAKGDWVGIARASDGLGSLASRQGDFPRAREFYEEALVLRHKIGDSRTIVMSLTNLANACYQHADYAEAGRLFGEVIAMARAAEEPEVIAFGLNGLGRVAHRQGDLVLATTQLKEALALRRASAPWHVGASLINLAAVLRDRGDVPRSAALYQEGLIHHATRREPHGVAEALAGLAELAASDGQTELAVRLLGAVETTRAAVGFRLQGPFAASGDVDAPEGHAWYERSIAPIRAELGDARYESELAAGQAMPLAHAVAEAAAFVPTPPRSRPNRPRSAG